MNPRIIGKPELKFIGLETPFIHGLSKDTNALKVIPPLWDEQFLPRAKEIPNRVGGEMYGIIYGKPKAQRAHPDELQYIAAVAVSQIGRVPQGMVSHSIPPTTYAVFVHRGPIRNIAKTCYEIYRVWLPNSGYEQTEFADVEMYDHRFDAQSADSELEYWISVKSK